MVTSYQCLYFRVHYHNGSNEDLTGDETAAGLRLPLDKDGGSDHLASSSDSIDDFLRKEALWLEGRCMASTSEARASDNVGEL